MYFHHSHELDRAEHSTGDLAGNIPLRQSYAADGEELGARTAREDWQALVGSIPGFHGGQAPAFSLMQVAVPECLPDRLNVLSYACELGILYDDYVEPVMQRELNPAAPLTPPPSPGLFAGVNDIQRNIFDQMIAVDPPRARSTIKHWQEFQTSLNPVERTIAARSLDAYLDYRLDDVGELLWLGLVTFGMALTIPIDELLDVRRRTRSCWIALSLQNDICSYAKEVKESVALRQSPLNAIAILMATEQLQRDDARARVHALLSHHVQRYQEEVERVKASALSSDSKTYIEALLYTLSGDAAWSLIAPRYICT